MAVRSWVHRHRVVLVMLSVLLLAAVSLWGAQLLRLRASVESASHWWSEPRGEAGGLVYVALGDSTAQGIGASAVERGYVGLVAERLRRATGLPVEVVNLSRSGATVEDVVEDQLVRPEVLDADFVTVGVGANDMPEYQSSRFDEDVRRLVAGLPVGAFVADVPDFMHAGARHHSQEAAATLRQQADEGGMVVVPLHAATKERGWAGMATDFAADWFHPNDRGYRVWADAFWGSISPRVDELGERAAHDAGVGASSGSGTAARDGFGRSQVTDALGRRRPLRLSGHQSRYTSGGGG